MGNGVFLKPSITSSKLQMIIHRKNLTQIFQFFSAMLGSEHKFHSDCQLLSQNL